MNLKLKQSSEKKNLFDDEATSSESDDSSSSSSEEEETKITVNKKFARDYQNRKQREELLQTRRRDPTIDDSEDEDSSDEEEDDDGNLLTNTVNLQFLKTIKALKKKDNAIYDPEARFFDEADGDDVAPDKEKSKKPQRYKDVIRNQILEQMEEDDNADNGKSGTANQQDRSKLAYDDQQEELRNAFLQESKKDHDNSEEEQEEDDWMVLKQKSSSPDSEQDSEIRQEFAALEKISKSKASEDSFKDPRGEVKNGESFLMDYIKNRKWMDNDDDFDQKSYDGNDDNGDDSSIEDIDKADDFEANYNFRFEQAAAETAVSGASLSIQTYARGQTMNTVRRQDTTRKDKRQARKERKEAERKAKEEQLKRLKNAKRQEMNQKLSEVKKVLGSVDEEAVDEAAIMKMLEGDYDPEKFEKAMQEAYGQDFYEQEDKEWKSDLDVRKDLVGDEDGAAIVGEDNMDGGMYDNYGEEEGGDNEDWKEDEDEEEYVGGDTEETKLEKKVKAKIQDELYKLDYEDIIAGMPTRFKYRQVEANDYGLTTQEILLARDTTLKQFVSLKKMAPYNENGEFNAGSKKRRRFREMLKQDLDEEIKTEEEANTILEEENEEPEMEEPQKKKRRRLKKGKKKSKGQESETIGTEIIAESGDKDVKQPEDTEKSKRRRKKKGKKGEATSEKTPKVETFDDGIKTKSLKVEKETVPSSTKNKKKRKRKGVVSTLSTSRLASYGL